MPSRRSRRHQEQQQQPQEYEEQYEDHPASYGEDDEEDLVEEVTRCTCGNDDLIIPPDASTDFEEVDTGFFIQCEDCSVWQHGYCVGIKDEDNSPEKYWCEQCKPDLHDLFTDKYGFKRSRYNPHLEASKRNKRKRVTSATSASSTSAINSSNNSSSTNATSTDIEPPSVSNTESHVPETTSTIPTSATATAATTAKSPQAASLSHNSASPIQSTTPTREDLKRERLLEEHERRKRTRGTLNSRDAEYELMLKKALEESAKESGVQPEDLNMSSSNESATRETRSSRKKGGVKEEHSADDDTNTTIASQTTAPAHKTPPTSSASENSIPPVKIEKPKSRKSKVKDESPSKTNNSTPTASKPKKDKVSKEQLSESKPFTANLPSSRISMNEMRRRIVSIMEFISNVQVELSNEEDFKNSLLTSRNEDGEITELQKTLVQCYNDSVLKLDSLTSKLNDWDNRYG